MNNCKECGGEYISKLLPINLGSNNEHVYVLSKCTICGDEQISDREEYYDIYIKEEYSVSKK